MVSNIQPNINVIQYAFPLYPIHQACHSKPSFPFPGKDSTPKISPRHIYQDIKVTICRSYSIWVRKICTVCHILESNKVCTYRIQYFQHRSRPLGSLARDLTLLSSTNQLHSLNGLLYSSICNPVRLFPDNMGCPGRSSICLTRLPPWHTHISGFKIEANNILLIGHICVMELRVEKSPRK